MSISPEQEKKPAPPEGITEVPETPQIPPETLKQTGIQPTQTQITTKVTDDSGQPMIQPADDTGQVTIQLPNDQQTLKGWTKGSITDSLTWFATFWLRMIKKAAHFGWRIIGKGQIKNGN